MREMETLHRALGLVEAFRTYNPEIPSQTMAVFLFVALHPGAMRKEIEKALGLSQAAANRHLAVLTKEGDQGRLKGKPGLNLIFTDRDPIDNRSNRAYLTKEGGRLVRDIARLLNNNEKGGEPNGSEAPRPQMGG